MTRLERELATVRAMLGLYCQHQHQRQPPVDLCPECADLWAFVEERVAHCPHLPAKPTCARCLIHCFKPDRRQQIRKVMRFAGPRMLWRHPWLTLLHVWDGRAPLGGRRRGLKPPGPGSP
jgi:hypothetical protein